MPWLPPGDLDGLSGKILVRAKDTAVREFDDRRERIENEEAARGALGGAVAHGCIDAAGTAIKSSANTCVSELLEVVEIGKALSRESVQWVRETVNAHIDGLVRSLGARIDDLKTVGKLKGNAARLEPFGLEGRRDVDIRLSHVEIDLPASSRRKIGHMYHLLVSGVRHTWSGSPAAFDRDRVFEFTDEEVKRRFGSLDAEAVTALLALPALFAYEEHINEAPQFGRLVTIVPRARDVRLEYEILPVSPFLSAGDLWTSGSELGIPHTFERNRTHWALKEVNLHQMLARRGISLPQCSRPRIDIETHPFEVALSFPGEKRDFVRPIADRLEHLLGQNSVFYDDFFPGELAQLGLDTLLQGIYGKRSRVVVVVAGADYQRKNWCGLEVRAIKDRIMARENRKVMIVRTDDAEVDGIFQTDGYLDARRFDGAALAGMIAGRVEELRSKA